MRKFIIFLVATFVLVAFSNAQSLDYEIKGTEVIFTHILENTGLSIKDAHDAVEAYYAKAYVDVTYTIKLNQEDHIIYKGIFPRVHYYGPFDARVISIPFTMDVSIKDNRIREKMIIEEIEDKDSGTLGLTGKYAVPSVITYYIVNLRPIGDGKRDSLPKETELKIFDNLCERILIVFSNLDKAIKNVKVEEDW